MREAIDETGARLQRVPHALRPPAVRISALEREPTDQRGEGHGSPELRGVEGGERKASQCEQEQRMPCGLFGGDPPDSRERPSLVRYA